MNPPPTDRPDGCTRTGAQRRRAKRRQRALRNGVPSAGEGGQLAPGPLSSVWGETFTRHDMIELGTAIRRDWPIPADKRAAFVALLWQTFDGCEERPRVSLAAARLALAMESANIRNQTSARRSG